MLTGIGNIMAIGRPSPESRPVRVYRLRIASVSARRRIVFARCLEAALVDNAHTTGVLVERSRQIHRARIAVQADRFRLGMFSAPLLESAPHTASPRHVKVRRKNTHIVQE